MPEIARFYGISIRIFFGSAEHNPPHIHAYYGERNATIDITSCTVIEGDLPRRALEMVLEWCTIHKKELKKIWNSQVFQKIPPLP